MILIEFTNDADGKKILLNAETIELHECENGECVVYGAMRDFIKINESYAEAKKRMEYEIEYKHDRTISVNAVNSY